ncbi:MAG: 50S ribosomal protein L5 [Chrysiogenetes bacterium]|nr:50S ribosomal protein L5 [Chrysiogenetes bacterium]
MAKKVELTAGITGDTGHEKGAPPRMLLQYRSEIVPALKEEFGFKNTMQVPGLSRVVLNMGLGGLSDAGSNTKVIEGAAAELAAISGQRPVVTRARKSIANFKLREGSPIGVMVTLRRNMMWEFFDRLINVSLPRVRDFRGVSPRGFDGRGNFTMGVREQIIFPEIDYDKIDRIKGLNITFVTSARTDEEGRALLTKLGMPFRK